MLEVHVDVGRLASLGGQKALEEQVRARRIHGGHAKYETDRAVRCAAAALTEDAPLARDGHDLVDTEKVGRDVERGDERELLLDLCCHSNRGAARITIAAAGFDEPPERYIGGLTR